MVQGAGARVVRPGKPVAPTAPTGAAVEEPQLSKRKRKRDAHNKKKAEKQAAGAKSPVTSPVTPAPEVAARPVKLPHYCLANILHRSGQGDACTRDPCKFVHVTSKDDLDIKRLESLLGYSGTKLGAPKLEAVKKWAGVPLDVA
jgi:hypothetical protein